jgi:hypothetical protein
MVVVVVLRPIILYFFAIQRRKIQNKIKETQLKKYFKKQEKKMS